KDNYKVIQYNNSEVFWDEIVSIEYVGKEEVFDLTIPNTHNFVANDFIAHNCMGKKKVSEMQKHREMFLDGAAQRGITKQLAEELFDQMVLFAEYCFNKSHSTAYAYVTYQTAYLKANYPVEYMTALLTDCSGNSDKVAKYIETCRNMGIKVEPPDINRSEVDFKPNGQNILFGLSAVRNLGEGAIENILKARQEADGKFKSLPDFCMRVDLRLVNRRALETLIKCGAFDSINPNRQQLFNDLDVVIPWAQSRAKDRNTGQLNMFDLGGESEKDNSNFDDAPSAKPTPDYSPADKLNHEKELLGFYVSDHPLKSVQTAAQILTPVNLSDLANQSSRQLLSVIVMLGEVKQITTKKGDPMAFVSLEDITTQLEGVVFPEPFQRVKDYLIPSSRLIIWGKVQKKDDKTQLIVEDAEPIESVRMVMIELTPQEALNKDRQNSLKAMLQEASGDKNKAKVPVVAAISGGGKRQLIRLDKGFWVQDSEAVVERLNAARFRARAEALIKEATPALT
ncbi:MAG: OB-fold nucleic acid binding domain-containing protein, partial [Chroococcales cyanobacterium]